MMNRWRSRRPKIPIHYGKRFTVSAWFPSLRLQDVADERTEGIVGYFLSCAHRRDPVKWQDDLYTLARSCYLQGASDTAVAMAMLRKEENSEKGPKGDQAP